MSFWGTLDFLGDAIIYVAEGGEGKMVEATFTFLGECGSRDDSHLKFTLCVYTRWQNLRCGGGGGIVLFVFDVPQNCGALPYDFPN